MRNLVANKIGPEISLARSPSVSRAAVTSIVMTGAVPAAHAAIGMHDNTTFLIQCGRLTAEVLHPSRAAALRAAPPFLGTQARQQFVLSAAWRLAHMLAHAPSPQFTPCGAPPQTIRIVDDRRRPDCTRQTLRPEHKTRAADFFIAILTTFAATVSPLFTPSISSLFSFSSEFLPVVALAVAPLPAARALQTRRSRPLTRYSIPTTATVTTITFVFSFPFLL